MRIAQLLFWAVLVLSVPGCEPQTGDTHDHDHETESAPTNRIAVPPEVISNIGITFENAQRGKLGRWLRVPGRLEVPNDRRWTLRASARGRVDPLVRVGQVVSKGTVLAQLQSPALGECQTSLLSASSAVENARVEATAAQARLQDAEKLVADAEAYQASCEQRRSRLKKLIAELERSSATAVSTKELIEAESALLDARERTLEAAVLRDDLRKRSRVLAVEVEKTKVEFDRVLATLSVLTGQSKDELIKDQDGRPHWQCLNELALSAPGDGIVMSVSVADGQQVAEETALIELFDPSTLMFHGHLPESDLAVVRPRAKVRIETAGTGNQPILSELWPSPLVLDESSRSLQVSAWVENKDYRFPHGLSATAYVQISESAQDEVLVPEDCVLLDDLEAVVFRRDPADPGFVVRTSVELGARSSGWVEILAGVLDGDELVRDGAEQLKRTGIGKSTEGGHFHADGTFHEGH